MLYSVDSVDRRRDASLCSEVDCQDGEAVPIKVYLEINTSGAQDNHSPMCGPVKRRRSPMHESGVALGGSLLQAVGMRLFAAGDARTTLKAAHSANFDRAGSPVRSGK
jgi:hypothetical protein